MASAIPVQQYDLPRKIKDARLKKKLSQDQAAAAVGTSRFQWIRWEKGENMPGLRYGLRIAELLGLDPDVFSDDAQEAALPGDPFRGAAAQPAPGDSSGDGAAVTEEVA